MFETLFLAWPLHIDKNKLYSFICYPANKYWNKIENIYEHNLIFYGGVNFVTAF